MMFQKFSRVAMIVGLAIAMLTAFAATPALAQELPGTSPGQAMAPMEGTITVDPTSDQWYAFKYDSDGSDDTDPSKAYVTLTILNGDVNFDVQTADRFGPYDDADDDPGPVGSGTPAYKGYDDDDGESVYNNARLTWVGSSSASDTYYVIVHGSGDYELEIKGNSVSFPAWTVENRAAFEAMGADDAMMDDETAAVADVN